jgi:hypothetical protein
LGNKKAKAERSCCAKRSLAQFGGLAFPTVSADIHELAYESIKNVCNYPLTLMVACQLELALLQ